jgi:hypothetical protein
MRYQAKPVFVEAFLIIAVSVILPDGTRVCHLAGGEMKVAHEAMMARYVPSAGDYWVRQEDGYEYINPKDVFERKYALVQSGHMPFGQALEALKSGFRVARRGWNGKGMWLAYSGGQKALPFDCFWATPNRDFARANGGSADVLPCITMKTASGEILMGWLASQSDMLANDWEIV